MPLLPHSQQGSYGKYEMDSPMRRILLITTVAILALSGCVAIQPPAGGTPLAESPLPTESATSADNTPPAGGIVSTARESEPTAESEVYLPALDNDAEADYIFDRAIAQGCLPNGGTTFVTGMVYLDRKPANGYNVVFSYQPDGPKVAEIISGPHEGYEGWRPGYYSHIMEANGARDGDWYFWVTDGMGVRISAIAHVHTDSEVGEGKCQQARVNFSN
jgi:hypothetical protein